MPRREPAPPLCRGNGLRRRSSPHLSRGRRSRVPLPATPPAGLRKTMTEGGSPTWPSRPTLPTAARNNCPSRSGPSSDRPERRGRRHCGAWSRRPISRCRSLPRHRAGGGHSGPPATDRAASPRHSPGARNGHHREGMNRRTGMSLRKKGWPPPPPRPPREGGRRAGRRAARSGCPGSGPAGARCPASPPTLRPAPASHRREPLPSAPSRGAGGRVTAAPRRPCLAS